jgi:hypothetical protein
VAGPPTAGPLAPALHPPSSSCLNLVERWFKELTDRRLRRGVFTSVPALIEAITTWVEHGNIDPKPFIWHAKAEDIITKVRLEGCAAALTIFAARALSACPPLDARPLIAHDEAVEQTPALIGWKRP